MTSVFGNSYTPFLVQDLLTNDLLDEPISSCVDSQGNLFIGCRTIGNTLFVLPSTDATIFGIPCTANTLTNLTTISGIPVDTRPVLCLDANDNLYIGDYFLPGLYVLTHTTSTIFGVECTANQATNIQPTVDPTNLLYSPTGMVFDSDGHLFVANGWDSNPKFLVLPSSTTTIFGVACSENSMTDISVVDDDGELLSLKGICIDTAGNIYIGNRKGNDPRVNTICVLPRQTGTIFGTSVTQNIVSLLTVASDVNPATAEAWGIRIDSNGNLVWSLTDNTLHVLPAANATIFGVPCVMHTPTDLTATVDPDTRINNPYDICFDANNNLFIINRGSSTPAILPNTQPVYSFPTVGFGIYITSSSTFLFDYTAIQRYIAGQSMPANQGRTYTPGTILTDTNRVVYSFGKNGLKTYAFREVQLPGSLVSVYLCIWAASGIYPVML